MTFPPITPVRWDYGDAPGVASIKGLSSALDPSRGGPGAGVAAPRGDSGHPAGEPDHVHRLGAARGRPVAATGVGVRVGVGKGVCVGVTLSQPLPSWAIAPIKTISSSAARFIVHITMLQQIEPRAPVVPLLARCCRSADNWPSSAIFSQADSIPSSFKWAVMSMASIRSV